MYARLWWKDLRRFWSTWVFLLSASLAAQGMALLYAGHGARAGVLPPLAASFAWLYAVAVGASAFAGERENGMLRFLDALPVERSILWRGKASFALVTTLVLAVLALIPAAAATDQWAPYQSANPVLLAVGYFVLVVEALGWGLLISALSRTALTAALGASGCAAASLGIVLLDLSAARQAVLLVQSIPVRLLVIAATASVSARVMTRGRAEGEGRSVGTAATERIAAALRPSAARAAEASRAAPPANIWARQPEIGSLVWLTFHQGWKIVGLLVLVGAGVPALIALQPSPSWSDAGFFVAAVGGVLLTAGVGVFGAENHGRTHRFLAHHGARPGLVWGAKLASWAFFLVLAGLAVVPVLFALGADALPRFSGNRAIAAAWSAAAWLYPFSIALCCGMAFRRGITAWAVSLIVLAALVFVQLALAEVNLASPWVVMVPPLVFVFLTWVWRWDWMLDRPAPGRWLRLGAWTVGAAAALFAGYAADRAWGVPSAPPIAPPAAWTAAATVPGGQNAARIYEEIERRGLLKLGSRRVVPYAVWGEVDPEALAILDANAEAYAMTRKAAALPICRYVANPSQMTAFDSIKYGPVGSCARLVAVHAVKLGERGDLEGAWDDVEAVIRIGRGLGRDRMTWGAVSGLQIEAAALDLATAWAADRRQTPKRLRGALAAYRGLPAAASAVEVVQGEAAVQEQTLALPRDEIRRGLIERIYNRKLAVSTWESLGISASTTPWELERARRVNRARFADMIEQVRHMPWARSQGDRSSPLNVPEAWPLSSLFPSAWFYVVRDDWNEIGRRAFEQILALRIWQLEHGGKLPESLGALTPDLLPKPVLDPFSGREFRYVESDGRALPPLGRVIHADAAASVLVPTVGRRLLYSVGPNRRDDLGNISTRPGAGYNTAQFEGDVVFPLPDEVR